MQPPLPDPRSLQRRDDLLRGLALVALALGAMGTLWGHPFVQDDMGIIYFNETAHAWSGLWKSFEVAYWPPVTTHELYRPLTISWFTFLWMIGDGAVWPFRVASLVIYALATLVVWRFLRRHVPPSSAWFGAAVFAVHPVHAEAVALAVNQAELLVGILLALAVERRILALRGELPAARAGLQIWLLFVPAIFIKEHALVLPGLLFATDLLLERGREPLGARLRRWLPHYLLLLATGALFWTIRTMVLGPGAGTQAAEALEGLSIWGRAYTMLGVPAEWLRLLIWPAALQGDWNMMEWVPTQAWSLRETMGVVALASVGLAFVLAFRRRPLLAFGIAWMAVAFAPVSNILVPTGIIIAERTLLLPSIGFCIVVADLVSPLELRWTALAPWVRRTAAFVGGLLLLLGMVRSGVRQTAWSSRPVYLATQVRDAPTSWRTRVAYGLLLTDLGDTASGRIEIRRAVALRPDRPFVSRELADAIRYNQGKCIGPSIIYEEILAAAPGRSDIRGSLVACYLFLGRYADARREAERGIALRLDPDYFRYVAAVADSAVRVRAPIQTVRLRPNGTFTVVGTPQPGVL